MHSLRRVATSAAGAAKASSSSHPSLVPVPKATALLHSKKNRSPMQTTRPRRCRPQRPTAAAAAATALSSSSTSALASTTFSVATVAAVCAYAALVTRPRSRLATFLTTSPLLPLAGCLSYLAMSCVFWPGTVSGAAARALASSLASSSSSSSLWSLVRPPDTSLFAALFASSPGATAMTWLHLLAGDFAAAAWVVRDARRLGGARKESSLFSWTEDDDESDGERQGENNKRSFFFKRPRHFPCAVSVVLCFMAGPLGIMSHLLMRRLWYFVGWAQEAKRGVVDDVGGSGGDGGGGDGGGGDGGGSGERGAAVLSTF